MQQGKVIIMRKILASLILAAGMVGIWTHEVESLTPQKMVVVLSGKPSSPAPPDFQGLIDHLGVTPLADYSAARCLAKAWLGKSIVNIRRSSDNATTDLNCLGSGTDIGNLDSAAFTAFCEGTTCYVDKLYDQSGNGYDVGQETAADQPQLLLDQTPNGKAALSFDGASQYLYLYPSTITQARPFTFSTFYNFPSVGAPGLAPLDMDDGTNFVISFVDETAESGAFGGDNLLTAVAMTPAEFYSTTVVFDDANSTIDSNGISVTGSTGSTTLLPAMALTVGATSGGGYYAGLLSEAMILPSGVSDAQQATILSNRVQYYNKPSFVAVGDSITVGYGTDTSWPKLVTSSSGQNNFNLGVAGIGWEFTATSQNLTQLAAVTVDPFASMTPQPKLVLFAGTNDIFNGSYTAAQTYAYFQTYIAARLAAGWQPSNIWVATMLPRQNNETQRPTYNSDLISGASTYGYNLVRLDQDPNIGLAGDEDNLTYYQSDEIHPTAAGQKIIANLVCSTIGYLDCPTY